MAKKLLETGDRELVEVRISNTPVSSAPFHADCDAQASPTDRIWGVGFGAADALENRSKWGENRLGEAITRVRERLRSESK